MLIARERADKYEHGLYFARDEKGTINPHDKIQHFGEKKARNWLFFLWIRTCLQIRTGTSASLWLCSCGRAVKILSLTQVCILCSPPNASASLDIKYFLVVAVSG